MAESGAIAGAGLLASGGLLAAYLRLRLDYDRTTSLLGVAILAGATPLLQAVLHSHDLLDVTIFAALSLASYAVAVSVRRTWVATSALAGVTLLVAAVAPEASTRPSLFSPSNGFLTLTPAVYVAVIGLMAGCRTYPAECGATLIALLLWPFAQASLVPALAWLAPGLALSISWARTRPVVAAAPVVMTLIVWNYWLMVQYTAGMIPKDAPVSFAAMVRQQADVHTRTPYVYPFSFPANLLAAWREGIPLTRYDTLATEPHRDRFDIRFDRSGDRFLLDGWGRAGANATGPYRTVADDRAELVFPFRPDPRGVEIGIVATLQNGGSHDAEAQLEINGHQVGRFHVSAASADESRVLIPPSEVGRIFRAGYNRLSIVTSVPARVAIHHLRIAPAA